MLIFLFLFASCSKMPKKKATPSHKIIIVGDGGVGLLGYCDLRGWIEHSSPSFFSPLPAFIHTHFQHLFIYKTKNKQNQNDHNKQVNQLSLCSICMGILLRNMTRHRLILIEKKL